MDWGERTHLTPKSFAKLFYSMEIGGATAPMGAPTAYAVTIHPVHFPAN